MRLLLQQKEKKRKSQQKLKLLFLKMLEQSMMWQECRMSHTIRVSSMLKKIRKIIIMHSQDKSMMLH